MADETGSEITLEALPQALQQLETLIGQKAGGYYAHAYAGISGAGEWSVSISGGLNCRIDKSFRARILADAIREATEWLERDDLAELNATLGLSPDGRFPEAASPAKVFETVDQDKFEGPL